MRRFLPRRDSVTWVATMILVALVVLGAIRFDHFASLANLGNILGDYGYIGIAAVGATLVIVSGGIDLSVGSVVAFTAVAIGALVNGGMHPLAASALALAFGAAIGATMGWFISWFELPPFIVTLVGMFAVRAACFLVSGESTAIAHPYFDRVASGWELPLGDGAALPFRGIVLLGLVGAGVVVARLTSFGRNLFAIGGNARAASMMGVNVSATTVGAYAVAGFCSALGGVVFTFYKRAGDPTAAQGLELSVIAAVVIGGTRLSGGVGSVAGTLVGVLILGVIRLLIDYQGDLNAAWTSVAIGGLLLAFVGIQQVIGAIATRFAIGPEEVTHGIDRSA